MRSWAVRVDEEKGGWVEVVAGEGELLKASCSVLAPRTALGTGGGGIFLASKRSAIGLCKGLRIVF
jgi:hypothetical protein